MIEWVREIFSIIGLSGKLYVLQREMYHYQIALDLDFWQQLCGKTVSLL